MSPLHINPEEDVKKLRNKMNNKLLRVVLGVALVVSVPIIKSTLAAPIRITNGPVQFGQGVVQAVACDPRILVTPESVFINESGGGHFDLLQVVLSGIDSTCGGKSFAIKIYDDAGISPLVSCTGAKYEVSNVQSGSFCSEGMEYSYENDTLTVSFGFENILAADVYKITVEESDAV